MKKNRLLILLAILALVGQMNAFAGDPEAKNDGTLVDRFRTLDIIGGPTSIAKDSSEAGEVDVNFNNQLLTGDITVQSTIVATGRVNATLSLASSSTIITGSNAPYALIIKHVGGTGTYDDLGVGTELANGKPGAELVLVVGSISSGSGDSWLVTPATSTAFDSLDFDAAGERAHLLYVDDTIGWIIRSTNATVNWTL